MGIVQTGSLNQCFPIDNLDSFSLVPSSFSLKTTLSNGLSVVKLDNNTSGLLFPKAISTHSQKTIVQKWIKSSFIHVCSILKHEISSLPFVCGIHLKFNALLEYGDHSLSDLLQPQQSKQTNRHVLSCFDSFEEDSKKQNFLRTLQIIKLMIQSAEEISQSSGQWIQFHTSSILYFESIKKFKYLYWPQFQRHPDRQSFFDPQTVLSTKKLQGSTVFSIGMVIMSLILGQDCSDCYDFRHFSFCQSVFEEKKEKVEDLTNKVALRDCSYSQVTSAIEQELANLALMALRSSQNRVSFHQFKQKYFQVLRKVSINCQNEGDASTKRQDRSISIRMKKSKAVKRTIPRRCGQGKDENYNGSTLNREVLCISPIKKTRSNCSSFGNQRRLIVGEKQVKQNKQNINS